MNLFHVKPPFQWVCPTCARHVVVSGEAICRQTGTLSTKFSAEAKDVRMRLVLIVCPSPDCCAPYVAVDASWGKLDHSNGYPQFTPAGKIGIGEFVFAPELGAPLSRHAPEQVRKDYAEGYLIRSLSPKASATLARRALQGMVRDYWQVNARTLRDEILKIADHIEPALFEAITALRSIGNIGAHPEHDAAVIVDIVEGEAEELLRLIKLLDDEWYVARARRADTLAGIQALGSQKKAARSSPGTP